MKHHPFAQACAPTRRTPVSAACAIVGALTGISAFAAEPAASVAEDLDEVVVTATRTPERSDAVAATITLRDARQIERSRPIDETGLFADEPDIDVPRDRRRFGAGSINIRGIEDNRVLQIVDGVRLPDFYNGGGPSNATTSTRDAPEFSFLKRVEVLRGPASSLYGSDAIGGVVSYITKEPKDLMKGAAFGGEAGLSWNGIDNGFGQTAGVAGGNEMLQGMFMIAHRSAHETKNMGEDNSTSPARTTPNPQDTDTNAWLGKLVLRASPAQEFRLAYEHRDADSSTDMRRLSPTLPRVTLATGTDDLKRDRVSLDYAWTPANSLLDRFTAQLYYQEAATHNVTYQTRSNTSASCSAVSRGKNQCKVDLGFDFRQRMTGLNLQADKTFTTGSVEQNLIVGADYLLTRSEEGRDGLVRNLTTGTRNMSLSGENFPIHDFPQGQTQQIGLFAQDELRFADGSFTLTPGLRFDHYALRPDADPLYSNAAGSPSTDKSDWAVSPKLSALWQATEQVKLWAQYVFGYRAPNYLEVNGGFRNLVQGYGAAPNPNLDAEKSRSFEIGARYTDTTVQTSVAVFDNRYKDFIEQVQLTCPSDPACLPRLRATYQYRNQTSVRIYGAEWRGAWNILPQWRIDTALAYAHGDNEDTGQPLNSVSPLRANAGLSWEPVEGRGAAVRWRGASSVTRTDDSSFAYFKPAGYGVADLQGWWRFNGSARLALSVDNLFDKKYWLWGDVRQTGVAANEAGVDFYTQPGRTFSASLTLAF